MRLFLLVLWTGATVADYAILTPGTVANTSLVELSTACVTALESTVSCDAYLDTIATLDLYGNYSSDLQQTLCSSACGVSLAAYHNSVISSCAKDPQPWQGVPPEFYGNAAWAAWNTTCLKDTKTGLFCSDYFANISLTGAELTSGQFPQAIACSPCVLSLGQMMQKTAYSNYGGVSQQWVSIQSQCGTNYATDVQPPPTNVTQIPGNAAAGTSVTSVCFSGNFYTVVSGDTCQVIAKSQGVSTGALISINDIFPDCSNLIAGASICLPQVCTTYLVQSGDTCVSISGVYNISFTQLLSWNPTINGACTNLIAGQNICVGLPGAQYNGTVIPGATVTQTAIYATTTVQPPGPVGSGTTLHCGKYYKVSQGDYCQLVSLNETIALPLFLSINPSINATCGNLVLGLYYCVSPTSDWNSTTSTYISAPSPTPTGTTPNCYEWHVVMPNDNCFLIETIYDISFSEFKVWNPALLSDCSNLVLGDAYCVLGDTSTPVTTTSTSSTASKTTYPTPPAPTPSGTTPNCLTWYTIVANDYCYLVYTKFSITFAQLQLWNPSLLDDCSNLVLGDAYCVQGVTATKRSLGEMEIEQPVTTIFAGMKLLPQKF